MITEIKYNLKSYYIMSSVEDTQNLITRAEELRDSAVSTYDEASNLYSEAKKKVTDLNGSASNENEARNIMMNAKEQVTPLMKSAKQQFSDAMKSVGEANNKAMTSRNRDLIMKTMRLRGSIQQAKIPFERDYREMDIVDEDINRCMEPDTPAELQCCSDAALGEEYEVMKRIEKNDGTVVVEYTVNGDQKKYVCFNRSSLTPSLLRSQSVRLCTPLAATTNSERIYGFQNNVVMATRVKYLVTEDDKVGDQVTLDVPQEDGSITKMEVTIPEYTDKYGDAVTTPEGTERCRKLHEDYDRYSSDLERAQQALEDYYAEGSDEDQSLLMQLSEEEDHAQALKNELEKELCLKTKPDSLIYFKTPNIRTGPAGSEELYIKLRFFGLDVGGVIDLKDFLYQIIGFPDVKRFKIEQRSPETFVMLSNALSVDQEVTATYNNFGQNLERAVTSAVDDALPAGVGTGEAYDWIMKQIDRKGELYSGEDKTKENSMKSARDIQIARGEVGAITDATSASHCQVGQETTVWLISPVDPETTTASEEEAAMTKVMELYSNANYTPVTIKSLRRKVVDIIKEMYVDPPEVLKDVTIYPDIDPDDIEEELDGPYESSLDDFSFDEGSANEEDMLEADRGLEQLRCYLAKNMAQDHVSYSASDNYDDIVDAMSAFHVMVPNQEPFIHVEVDEIKEKLAVDGETADKLCDKNDVTVDGDYRDPGSYRLIMRAFGSTGAHGLFGNADMETDSEDEFDRGAAQVSHNLGFVAEPERYTPDGSLHLSHLEESNSALSDPGSDSHNPSQGSLHLSHLEESNTALSDEELSEVGTLHTSDTESVTSLDLRDYDLPESPQGALLTSSSQRTPSHDPNSFPPQSPPQVMRLRRRLRTEDLVDGDLTNISFNDGDEDGEVADDEERVDDED